MRGLVVQGAPRKWRFVKATAVVLVSGVDDLYKGSTTNTSEAPNNEASSINAPDLRNQDSPTPESGDEYNYLLDWSGPSKVVEQVTAGPTVEELEKVIDALTDVRSSSPPYDQASSMTLFDELENWINGGNLDAVGTVSKGQGGPPALQDDSASDRLVDFGCRGTAVEVGESREDDMLNTALEWVMEQDISESRNPTGLSALHAVFNKDLSGGPSSCSNEIRQGALLGDCPDFTLGDVDNNGIDAVPLLDSPLTERFDFATDPLFTEVNEVGDLVPIPSEVKRTCLSADERSFWMETFLKHSADPGFSSNLHDKDATLGIASNPSSAANKSVWIDDAAEADCFVDATGTSVADPTISTSTLANVITDSTCGLIGKQSGAPIMQHGDPRGKYVRFSDYDAVNTVSKGQGGPLALQDDSASDRLVDFGCRESAVEVGESREGTMHDNEMLNTALEWVMEQDIPESRNSTGLSALHAVFNKDLSGGPCRVSKGATLSVTSCSNEIRQGALLGDCPDFTLGDVNNNGIDAVPLLDSPLTERFDFETDPLFTEVNEVGDLVPIPSEVKRTRLSADERSFWMETFLKHSADPGFSSNLHDKGAALGIASNPSSAANKSVWIDDAAEADCFVDTTGTSVADPTISTSTLANVITGMIGKETGAPILQQGDPRGKYVRFSDYDAVNTVSKGQGGPLALRDHSASGKLVDFGCRESAVEVDESREGTTHDDDMLNTALEWVMEQDIPESRDLTIPSASHAVFDKDVSGYSCRMSKRAAPLPLTSRVKKIRRECSLGDCPDLTLGDVSNDGIDIVPLLDDSMANWPNFKTGTLSAEIGEVDELPPTPLGSKRSFSSAGGRPLLKRALQLHPIDPKLACSLRDKETAVGELGCDNIKVPGLLPGIINDQGSTAEKSEAPDNASGPDCSVNSILRSVIDLTSPSPPADRGLTSPASDTRGGMMLVDSLGTSSKSVNVGDGILEKQSNAIAPQQGDARENSVTSKQEETFPVLDHRGLDIDFDTEWRAQEVHNHETSSAPTEPHNARKTSSLTIDCTPTPPTVTLSDAASVGAPTSIESIRREGQLSYSFAIAKDILMGKERPENVTVPPSGRNADFYCYDADYLTPWWIFTQLVHPIMEPSRFRELQTAFELYGYDDIDAEEVFGKALGLTYMIWKDLRSFSLSHLSDQVLQERPSCSIYRRQAAAVEIVNDSFFRGRPLRPDLKTYLSKKVMLPGNETLRIPPAQGISRRNKGQLRSLKIDWATYRKCTDSPGTELTHPFSFDRFCHDVSYILGCRTEPKLLTTLQSKYQRVFGVDILAQVMAVMKAAPTAQATEWLELAARKGFVPLRRVLRRYTGGRNVAVQCLAGGVANLYMSLLTNLRDRDNDSESKFVEAVTSSVRCYLATPGAKPAVRKGTPCNASQLLRVMKTVLGLTETLPSKTVATDRFELSRQEVVSVSKFLTAPFKSPEWVMSQLLLPHLRPRELRCAFDSIGLVNVDVNAIANRALLLATKSLALQKCIFTLEEPGLATRLQPHMLAAKVLHAAIFQQIPLHRDRIQWFQKQIRHDVLPEHKRCLREVLNLRKKLHSTMELRSVKGHTEVEADWHAFLQAISTVPRDKSDYPLSFRQFIVDLQVVSAGASQWTAAVISKYKTLFNRDILKDFTTIRRSAPDVTEGNSFIEGIEDGFVPYSFAYALASTRQKYLLMDKNVLHLAGALVTYYRSLLGAERPSDGVDVGQSNDELREHDARSEPHACDLNSTICRVLNQAPPQRRLEAVITNARFRNLHPVASFLVYGSNQHETTTRDQEAPSCSDLRRP